jgi:peptidoglycan/xylan/chitin deacetylase (PgdA/CDA1 family)
MLTALKALPLYLTRCLCGDGARIVIYHRFHAAQRADIGAQFEHIRRYYRPTSLGDLARMLAEGREPPPGTVVVTVDDGYRDFYRVAYPVLRKYGIPATLFVVTGFIDRACWLWVDRVTYCLGDTEMARSVKEELKHLDLGARDARLAELEHSTGVRVPAEIPCDYEPCSWDELREMASHGIEIGAHTVTHPILSRISDPARLAFEILGSKKRIEDELQRPVLHFAYPNGLWDDFGPEAVRLVRANFKTGVAAVTGWNHAGTDLHQLYRTAVPAERPVGNFARRLAGLSAAVRIAQPRAA